MAKPKKKIVDTRSAKKKAKDAAFAKLPVAAVRSPLKFLNDIDGHWTIVDGQKVWERGHVARAAIKLSKRGDGPAVQSLARRAHIYATSAHA